VGIQANLLWKSSQVNVILLGSALIYCHCVELAQQCGLRSGRPIQSTLYQQVIWLSTGVTIGNLLVLNAVVLNAAGAGFDTPPAYYIFQLVLADWLMCLSVFLLAKHLERAMTSSSKDEEDSGYDDSVDFNEELV
jgi:hypothetical protein